MAVGTPWEAFFLAGSGVAAALAGLVFIGLSINLDHILEHRGLHLHGLEALSLLIAALVLCLSALVPAQSAFVFTAEVGTTTLLLALMGVVSTKPMAAVRRQYARGFTIRVASAVIVVAAYGMSAATASDRDVGLGWLAAAVILSILSASLKAWVLLVVIELDNPNRRPRR